MPDPIPLVSTFDIPIEEGGPRRPSLADLGEAKLRDDLRHPPLRPEMPCAAQLNQWAMQLAAIAKMIGLAVVHVEYSGATPAVVRAWALGSNMLPESFSLTAISTGIVEISWNSGVLPPIDEPPEAYMTASGQWQQAVATRVATRRIRVEIRNGSGVATNGNFKLRIL